MRNGLGLSGNQLERYQTQRSIVIKKQAELVNCSALGSLAIEKGFETTVDKLLKELLKKAAGAVGGVLGGAAAISGGIVIGMLLSTEEVGESKEELDELEREQEKKKDNEDRNDSGGSKKKKPKQDKEGDSETNAPKNETPINQGNSKPPQKSTPNSVYEQLNPDGTVKSRAFYDKNGNQFNRQDFDHQHFDKNTQQDLQPHENNYQYNDDGLPNGNSAGPLKPGYDNRPSN